jgi:hypothetical protein
MPTQTITTTAQDAADIADAVGDALGLSGPASAAQVKDYQIDGLRQLVRAYKRKKAIAALTPPADIAPT